MRWLFAHGNEDPKAFASELWEGGLYACLGAGGLLGIGVGSAVALGLAGSRLAVAVLAVWNLLSLVALCIWLRAWVACVISDSDTSLDAAGASG